LEKWKKRCELLAKKECPLMLENPGECPFMQDIVELKVDCASIQTDIGWLKKRFNLQTGIELISLVILTVIGLLIKFGL